MTKWVGHRKDKSEICERLVASTLGHFELTVWLFVWTDHIKLNGLGGAFWLFGHLG